MVMELPVAMEKSSSVELSPQLALLALSQRHIQNVVHFPFLTLWTWGRGAEELVASSMRRSPRRVSTFARQ